MTHRTARVGQAVLLVGAAVAITVLATAGAAAADPTPAPAPGPISAPAPASPSSSATTLPGIYGPGFSPDSSIPPPSAPVPGQDDKGSDPGFFDIPGQIEKAIDTWFGKLVKLALDPVLHLVGSTLLSTPNLTDGRISQVWDGVLITANTLYVLLVLVAGVTVMGHETVQTRHGLKEIAPRLILGVIASNASLWAINQVVAVGNALSAALMNGQVSAEGIGNVLTSMIVDKLFLPTGPMNLFFLLLGLAVAVLGSTLLVGYLIRAAITVILTVGAPLALACHALPQTEGLARLWWRAIFGCVAVQVVQALVLITAVQVFFDPQANSILGLPNGGTLLDLLICLCLFVVLLKIPGWVRRIVLGRSPFHTSPVGSLARQLITYGGVRKAAPYLGTMMQNRLRPPGPRPTPPPPGTGLAARRPRPGPGGGGPAGMTWSATQTWHSGPTPPHGGAPSSSTRPAPLPTPPATPAAGHALNTGRAVPQQALPTGPFGKMLSRAPGPQAKGRQMGLFPPLPPTVRPDSPLPPPGPAASHHIGVVRGALFSPTTLAPLPRALPPKPKAGDPPNKDKR
jgi:hypothetical protein